MDVIEQYQKAMDAWAAVPRATVRYELGEPDERGAYMTTIYCPECDAVLFSWWQEFGARFYVETPLFHCNKLMVH